MELCYDGALVMPSNYAVMSEEEMTYVEGGKYISKSKCLNALCGIGINPYTYIGAALSYTLAKVAIRKVCQVAGGIAGWVVGIIFTWGAGQVISFAKGLCRGAIHRGVDITWNWRPTRGNFGVNCSVRW